MRQPERSTERQRGALRRPYQAEVGMTQARHRRGTGARRVRHGSEGVASAAVSRRRTGHRHGDRHSVLVARLERAARRREPGRCPAGPATPPPAGPDPATDRQGSSSRPATFGRPASSTRSGSDTGSSSTTRSSPATYSSISLTARNDSHSISGTSPQRRPSSTAPSTGDALADSSASFRGAPKRAR